MIHEKMSEAHVDQIHKIEKLVYEEPWPKRTFRNIMDKEPWTALVCIDETVKPEAVVGYFVLRHHKDKEWHIENLTVHPDYRRRGIAFNFMEIIRDIVGDDQVMIIVKDEFLLMHLLLKKSGMKAVKIEKLGDIDYYIFVNKN